MTVASAGGSVTSCRWGIVVLDGQGSVVIRDKAELPGRAREDGTAPTRTKMVPCVLHCDVIGKEFWEEHPEILK